MRYFSDTGIILNCIGENFNGKFPPVCSKKIRSAAIEKIPGKIIIGEREVSNIINDQFTSLSINWREDFDHPKTLDMKALQKIIEENKI